MLCDICGGNLVMQPGATAKCDCRGMDYSTESLKAKFAAFQETSTLQKEHNSTSINGMTLELDSGNIGTTVETRLSGTGSDGVFAGNRNDENYQ